MKFVQNPNFWELLICLVFLNLYVICMSVQCIICDLSRINVNGLICLFTLIMFSWVLCLFKVMVFYLHF